MNMKPKGVELDFTLCFFDTLIIFSLNIFILAQLWHKFYQLI